MSEQAPGRPDVLARVVVAGVVVVLLVLLGPMLLDAVNGDDTAGKTDAVVGIDAPGSVCWSANVGSATQEGCGDRSFPVHDPLGLFSSNVQKKSAGSEVVRISVQIDGRVVASNATSAAYGVAQVVVSP